MCIVTKYHVPCYEDQAEWSFVVYCVLLGPFYRAIAVPSVTRCRCRHRRRRGHWCAGGMRHLVNGRAAARSGEWAQHFSNASCIWNVWKRVKQLALQKLWQKWLWQIIILWTMELLNMSRYFSMADGQCLYLPMLTEKWFLLMKGVIYTEWGTWR